MTQSQPEMINCNNERLESRDRSNGVEVLEALWLKYENEFWSNTESYVKIRKLMSTRTKQIWLYTPWLYTAIPMMTSTSPMLQSSSIIMYTNMKAFNHCSRCCLSNIVYSCVLDVQNRHCSCKFNGNKRLRQSRQNSALVLKFTTMFHVSEGSKGEASYVLRIWTAYRYNLGGWFWVERRLAKAMI